MTITVPVAKLPGFARRLAALVSSFAGESRGLAALEFAFLLPVMLTLYLGSYEVTTGVAVQRKVTLTAHALADLSSQFTSIANSDMTNILNASSDIIAPYAAADLAVVVSELAINGQGQASVVWSNALNGTALTVGQTVTVPISLAVPNTYLILGQASYTYNPTYGYVVTGPLTLSDQILLAPRQSNSIARTS
jgi:Flp pilus assembly protein TadG